jgi:hypothetical protein
VPTYFTFISRPMDLGTISANLKVTPCPLRPARPPSELPRQKRRTRSTCCACTPLDDHSNKRKRCILPEWGADEISGRNLQDSDGDEDGPAPGLEKLPSVQRKWKPDIPPVPKARRQVPFFLQSIFDWSPPQCLDQSSPKSPLCLKSEIYLHWSQPLGRDPLLA